ncbi:hypothetical protein CCR75_006178 [Bremia lactucae]|uniref:Nucleolar protein 12 n=1 Tax=Bremia lactucae TaxID=4779 RepID=A0A976ID92_BRELC|nr:hypothetical protein CCR75_006178 [Bremia lactucae]
MTRVAHGATSRQGKRGAVGKAKLSRGSTGMGANPNLRKKSKLVVTFDSDKRKEYLTGFHKRKQERRRFGLDMEAFKIKKRQLEAKKQRREDQKEKLAALNLVGGDKEEHEEEQSESESDVCTTESQLLSGAKTVTEVMTFADEITQKKFGDCVIVTTSVGNLQSDSDESSSDVEISGAEETKKSLFQRKKGKNGREEHLTLFQRVQQQRKGKALPSKRSKLQGARTARKATAGKKRIQRGAAAGNKRGAEDRDGVSAASKLNRNIKAKRQHGGGSTRQKKR